jgi:hypothetical protein
VGARRRGAEPVSRGGAGAERKAWALARLEDWNPREGGRQVGLRAGPLGEGMLRGRGRRASGDEAGRQEGRCVGGGPRLGAPGR